MRFHSLTHSVSQGSVKFSTENYIKYRIYVFVFKTSLKISYFTQKVVFLDWGNIYHMACSLHICLSVCFLFVNIFVQLSLLLFFNSSASIGSLSLLYLHKTIFRTKSTSTKVRKTIEFQLIVDLDCAILFSIFRKNN